LALVLCGIYQTQEFDPSGIWNFTPWNLQTTVCPFGIWDLLLLGFVKHKFDLFGIYKLQFVFSAKALN